MRLTLTGLQVSFYGFGNCKGDNYRSGTTSGGVFFKPVYYFAKHFLVYFYRLKKCGGVPKLTNTRYG